MSTSAPPLGCLFWEPGPCTCPRLVSLPGVVRSSNPVCPSHRSYPAKVFWCSVSTANSAGSPNEVSTPDETTGHAVICVRFHRFFAMRSVTSSAVLSGESEWPTLLLLSLDWNPNKNERVPAIGATLARHASTPFSIAEPPVGAGPRRDKRGSSSFAVSSSSTGSSRSSTENGAFTAGFLDSNESAALFATTSSGAGATIRKDAPGAPERDSEISASLTILRSCFRFMSSAIAR